MEQELRTLGISPATYLGKAKLAAQRAGYNPRHLSFADDVYKLKMIDEQGRERKFGRVGYGDFLLYTIQEKRGKVAKGTAASKRRVFHASHEAIPGKWRDDKFSANHLALQILW